MNLYIKKILTFCGFIFLIVLSGCGLKGELYQTPSPSEVDGVVSNKNIVKQDDINAKSSSSGQSTNESTSSDNNLNNPSSK